MRTTYWVPVLLLGAWITSTALAASLTVTDMAGRTVSVPVDPGRIICIGPGSLRLIVYLDAQEKVVGVEAMEKRRPMGRPYWLAHPRLHELPRIGPGGPGAINKKPDMEAVLRFKPDLIFVTYMDGALADDVSGTLNIPVVVLNYGALSIFDHTVYDSLMLAGRILDRQERARTVIDTIRRRIADLRERTASLTVHEKRRAYVGGIGYRGAHGIESTQRNYMPLGWINAINLAKKDNPAAENHVYMEKEILLGIDPDVIFIDGGGLALVVDDFRKRPDFYHALTAFRSKRVYTLLPFNLYTTNIATALADAYAIGKTLYPNRFEDVDLAVLADQIYTFLVGQPVYEKMKSEYGHLGEIAPFLK